MDTSQLRHPLRQDSTNGATSTHGLNLTERETSQGQNHNIGTAEVGFEVVAEPRSARAELSRRAGGRELSSEEMLIAYGELEREMNELRNNIGRRTNTGDMGALSAWRERVKISRAETYGDIESRAAILADAAVRVRERQYGGTRVLEVAPIRESTAHAIDAPEGRLTSAAPKEASGEAETINKSRVKTEKIKKEKTSEEKKIKLEKKVKMKSRQPSISSDSSEEEDDIPVKRTSRQKEKGEKKRSKHRISDTGEDGHRNKKSTIDKTCKDKVKMKNRRKLEFLTDESSEEERPKTTRKTKTAREDDSTSQTSTEEDSMSDASTIKSTRKENHKNGKH